MFKTKCTKIRQKVSRLPSNPQKLETFSPQIKSNIRYYYIAIAAIQGKQNNFSIKLSIKDIVFKH